MTSEQATGGAAVVPAALPRGHGRYEGSVSLDEDVAAAVDPATEEAGVSFSAWLGETARLRLLISDGLRAVDEWESDAGALTDEERAACELLLGHILREQPGGIRGA